MPKVFLKIKNRMEERNINLNEKEIKLLISVLKDYENKVYDGISKKENDFIFNLIDKLNTFYC